MLRLASRTAASWADWAVDHLDAILLDHAHCEKKAASTALNLIFRYPDHAPLMRPLSALAREELEHFELVLTHLERRGQRFERQLPSPYAPRLLEVVRHGEPQRLLDTLLCCSLIEARSCERMQMLSEALKRSADRPLFELYESLLACEARHHQAYVDLAMDLFDPEQVRPRLLEIAQHEAAVIASAPQEPRLHNAAPSPS